MPTPYLTPNDFLKELSVLIGNAEKALTEPELLFFMSQAIHYLSTANSFRIALSRSEKHNTKNNIIDELSTR